MNFNRLRKIQLLLTLLTGSIAAFAQTGIDSPYSRFGVGMTQNKNTNARFQAMGGVSNAMTSIRVVNPSNPATYTSFDSLSFIFNAGFNGSSVTYRTTTQTEQGTNATLSYVTMGFPVTRWWRSSLGLLPYSQVGYNIKLSFYDEQIGRYNKVFKGTGGLNEVYWGNGFKISDHFSAGVNANYIFGRNTNSILLYSPDSAYYANTKTESRLQVSDFLLDYGILFKHGLGNKLDLNIGLTYSQKVNLSVKREYLVRSMFGGVDDGVEYILDTIDYRPKEKGTIILPDGLGFGFSLVKQNRWLVGMDLNWKNWEKYKVFGSNDSLNNSWNVALGGQFTPNNTSISGYWKRVSYRMGTRYEHTYIQLLGEPINEFGISFGVGLPLPRTNTTIDVSAEIGRRGTTNKNLIQETFVNFTLGVSIYERWFEKRRYN